jgi:hypothetical protein
MPELGDTTWKSRGEIICADDAPADATNSLATSCASRQSAQEAVSDADLHPIQNGLGSSAVPVTMPLLGGLEWLQEELRCLHDQLQAKLSTKPTRRKANCQCHEKALQIEADR